jgi:protein-disulfide isomerase
MFRRKRSELVVPRLMVPVSERDHILGPVSAPVTLVEYGDYACPHCGRAFPMIRELQRRLGNRMRFVFRHYPQIAHHPRALPAAEAAEAAAEQGRFWEMHAYLFERQHALEDSDLRRYARALGLDQARFELALDEHRYRARIEEDITSGTQSGVRATPTFFINDLPYDDSHDYESLLIALEVAQRGR